MLNPLVSIIIPTYNRAQLIGETLDSIIAQTYINWECIVVDDGSTDNTEDLLKKYIKKDSRIQYHHRPNDREKGANACRNYGFELSKGEHINWFDSDDLMFENKLKIQVKRLEETSCFFTVCQTIMFEGSINNLKGLRKEKVYSKDFLNDFITNKIKFLTQSPIFKRNFIDDNNLRFDETLSRSQEKDFFVKALVLVKSYDFTNEPLVYFRLNPLGISYSKITEEKVFSSFKVNQRILTNNKELLSADTLLYLKKFLINEYRNSLGLNYYKLSRYFLSEMIKKDNNHNLSFINKKKLELAYWIYKVFNKGYFLIPKI